MFSLFTLVHHIFSLLSVYSGIPDNQNVSLREQLHKKTLSTGWLFQYPAHLPLCYTPLRKYEKFHKDHRFTNLFFSYSSCTRKAECVYNSYKLLGFDRINFSMYAAPKLSQFQTYRAEKLHEQNPGSSSL